MREIKFRAWNGNEMVYDWFKIINIPAKTFFGIELPEYVTTSSIVSCPLAVMQFTGLQDKNGVDIYEGDICKDCEDDSIGTVKYYEDNAVYVLEWLHQSWVNYGAEALKCIAKFEMIGNIYENPELLEK